MTLERAELKPLAERLRDSARSFGERSNIGVLLTEAADALVLQRAEIDELRHEYHAEAAAHNMTQAEKPCACGCEFVPGPVCK